jgi:hypothetical protein
VDKKKHSKASPKALLKDYKKVGSTFVPPMVHRFDNLDYISWSTQTLPELIWWAVLANRFSHRFAAQIAEEIGKCLATTAERKFWWAFISDYAHLEKNEVSRLKQSFAQAGLLDRFLHGLTDFLNLYPECPLARFLDSPPTGAVDTDYLTNFESLMSDLENKRSRNGVLAQAQVVYLGFVSGRLHVKKGLVLADFPEVQHYPTTERSKQVGASICATVNMLVGTNLPKYGEDVWVQYFWRRSLELRPLNFDRLENG